MSQFSYRLPGNSEDLYSQTVIRIKKSLSKVLVPFFSFAERWVAISPGSPRRKLLCNDKGVPFIDAKLDTDLDSIVKASTAFQPVPELTIEKLKQQQPPVVLGDKEEVLTRAVEGRGRFFDPPFIDVCGNVVSPLLPPEIPTSEVLEKPLVAKASKCGEQLETMKLEEWLGLERMGRRFNCLGGTKVGSFVITSWYNFGCVNWISGLANRTLRRRLIIVTPRPNCWVRCPVPNFSE
ncbi:unnamed protein product [Calypogeia fissa]